MNLVAVELAQKKAAERFFRDVAPLGRDDSLARSMVVDGAEGVGLAFLAAPRLHVSLGRSLSDALIRAADEAAAVPVAQPVAAEVQRLVTETWRRARPTFETVRAAFDEAERRGLDSSVEDAAARADMEQYAACACAWIIGRGRTGAGVDPDFMLHLRIELDSASRTAKVTGAKLPGAPSRVRVALERGELKALGIPFRVESRNGLSFDLDGGTLLRNTSQGAGKAFLASLSPSPDSAAVTLVARHVWPFCLDDLGVRIGATRYGR